MIWDNFGITWIFSGVIKKYTISLDLISYCRNWRQKCKSELISNCIDVCYKEVDIEASSRHLQYWYNTIWWNMIRQLCMYCFTSSSLLKFLAVYFILYVWKVPFYCVFLYSLSLYVCAYFGCVHKLTPGNPGYDPAVHKLITETGLIVYERLVLNRVRNWTTLLASRIVWLKMASSFGVGGMIFCS